MTWSKSKQAADSDRGLPPWTFAATMTGAFTVVALCALTGGWPGLIGIAVTATLLTAYAATRL
ncbi:hypothetical protein ABTZ58_39580 [Streptomyces sp. NPDC094143]|uniref:hypothetical protein n=1 Tax=Streptomyces sp. NPDC094143 TaxID=3155310 RepID=UPI00331FE923